VQADIEDRQGALGPRFGDVGGADALGVDDIDRAAADDLEVVPSRTTAVSSSMPMPRTRGL
jgi:hypothetical protein